MKKGCFMAFFLLLIFCAGFGISMILHSRERSERKAALSTCARKIPQRLRDLYISRPAGIDAYLSDLETHMKGIVFPLDRRH